MPLPIYQELYLPALELLSDGKERKIKDFEIELSKVFELSDAELSQVYKSGNAKIFKNRIRWVLSNLNTAGFVQKPKRGVYRISEAGKEQLKNKSDFKNFLKSNRSSREPTARGQENAQDSQLETKTQTPEELLFHSYTDVKEKVYREILDTILSKTPREFEKLVVQLLQKMGYGGEINDSGTVTQSSNDGGIDGIIREDVLGFGRIHIQAKRYTIGNNISREDIQKFVGALAVAQSDKGVFITTSSFSRGAYEYVKNLNSSSANIVLIDGQQLAEYIYDFDLGMQVEGTIVLKQLDSDYWDNLQDEQS